MKASQLCVARFPSTSLVFTVFLCILLTPNYHGHNIVLAQSSYYVPITVSGPAVARTQTKLYVLGGNPAGAQKSITQFMRLDLNATWNTTSPAWTKLNDGPSQAIFPAAFTSDEKTMFVFHIPGFNIPFRYSVDTDAWSRAEIEFEDMSWQGISVITDPRTGLMYLPGGYSKASATYSQSLANLQIFDPITLSFTTSQLPIQSQVFPVRWYTGNVWSKKKNLILYFGGNNLVGVPPVSGLENVVTAFSPDTLTWFTMPTAGQAPAMRADHCMAINEEGTKVVIYGGRLRNNTISGEVFILDVDTQQWTPGVTGPSRMYTACTIAGSQLIIWGGSNSDTAIAPSQMLVYNYVTGVWSTQYTPPASYASLSPPPTVTRTAPPWGTSTALTRTSTGVIIGTGSANPNPTKTSQPGPTETPSVPVGIITGGIVGGLVLAAALVGIFFFRYRRNKSKQKGRSFFIAHSTSSHDPDESRSLANNAAMPSIDRRPSLGRDPMESHEEYELERSLMEIEKQKRELELRQQMLVLQHRAENPDPAKQSGSSADVPAQKRGPTAYVEPEAEYIPAPSPHFPNIHPDNDPSPKLLSPALSPHPASGSITSSTSSVRIVSPSLVTTSPSPSSIVRTTSTDVLQGELVQMTPEPSYSPTSILDTGYPDLIYQPKEIDGGNNNGKEWVRKAPGPQTAIVSEKEGGRRDLRGPSALLPTP
ncbi:hypothetical protein FBU30_009481 [Linnemannia zychae]|nr:hypothetical protein FBU30_009481 [Linnemannia zychae]